MNLQEQTNRIKQMMGLIIEQGKVLVTQRREGDSHGLLWEFPGGR
jgi:8-oxo-dGTP pyrophosphatase MutT (NUDIX family)